MKVLVSIRGNVDSPTLLVINTKNGIIEKKLEYDEVDVSHVPKNKRGLAGISITKDKIFVTGWDFILVLDKFSLQITDVIYHKRFSDLHDCSLFNQRLLIANTNLDGIYAYCENQINPIWHTWEDNKSIFLDPDIEYSKMVKSDTGLHQYHLNAVCETDHQIIATFLGTNHTKIRGIRRYFIKKYSRRGGYFILNKTNSDNKIIWNEGLHDLVPWKNKFISTEYFGQKLVFLSPSSQKIDKLLLKQSPFTKDGYLLRGVLPVHDGFLIGHTVENGWDKISPEAIIAHYTPKGEFVKVIAMLKGVVGIYSIKEWDNEN